MAKPRKHCIFCGGYPASKEHIWSKWTYKLVPKRPHDAHTRGNAISSPHDPRTGRITQLKNYQGNVSTIKIRAVCRPCNNGWMSGMEEAVKPLLSPLIMGRPLTLGEKEQLTLATWIAMKFMVAELSDPTSVSTPASEREHLRLHLQPPPNWSVWIAPYRGEVWRTGYQRFSATLGTLDSAGVPVPPNGSLAKNTQSLTLGIGRMIASAFSSTIPGLTFKLPPKTAPFVRKIWPTAEPVWWQPDMALSDAGAEFVANYVARSASLLKWNAPT